MLAGADICPIRRAKNDQTRRPNDISIEFVFVSKPQSLIGHKDRTGLVIVHGKSGNSTRLQHSANFFHEVLPHATRKVFEHTDRKYAVERAIRKW